MVAHMPPPWLKRTPLLLNVAALGATVVVGVLGATVVVDDRCRRPIAEPLPLGGAEVP